MLLGVIVTATAGLLVCLYGVYVEHKVQADHTYKAACDLSDRASCTKTILSPWGKLLGISNMYVGILFYLGMIALGFLNMQFVAYIGAVLACLASIYLAYILYTKVKTFCLLCSSVYLINIILLVITYRSL